MEFNYHVHANCTQSYMPNFGIVEALKLSHLSPALTLSFHSLSQEYGVKKFIQEMVSGSGENSRWDGEGKGADKRYAKAGDWNSSQWGPLGSSLEHTPKAGYLSTVSPHILVNQCHQHEPFFSSSISSTLLIHSLIKADGFLAVYTDSASHFLLSSHIQTHKPLGQSSVNPLSWEPCLQSQPGAILATHYRLNTSDRMLLFSLARVVQHCIVY